MLTALGGEKEKLVIDLSCRRVSPGWKVAMEKWQTITSFDINRGTLYYFSSPFSSQTPSIAPCNSVIPTSPRSVKTQGKGADVEKYRKHRYARAIL